MVIFAMLLRHRAFRGSVAVATFVAGSALATVAHAGAYIGGGTLANSCEVPPAVALFTSDTVCSGTLIHPSIVLYAGQCGAEISQIFIGDDVEQTSGRIIVPDFCEVYPEQGDDSPAHDFAFCHLPYRISEIPHTPIIYGCELDQLEAGCTTYLAGFGETVTATVNWGVKHWGKVIYDTAKDGVITTTVGVAGCIGDVGAGLFRELSDGTWRTVGVLSNAKGTCELDLSTNTFGFAPDIVPWLEKRSGEDVLPCFGRDGEWSPTPSCKNHLRRDLTEESQSEVPGAGTWDTWCADTLNSGYAATCGEQSSPDLLPPIVRLEEPADGAIINSDTVTIRASVNDDVALARVDLIIDGVVAASEKRSPFLWNYPGLAQGLHTVTIRAYDEDFNLAEVEHSITIEATQQDDDDDSLPPDDDDDQDTQSDSMNDTSTDDSTTTHYPTSSNSSGNHSSSTADSADDGDDDDDDIASDDDEDDGDESFTEGDSAGCNVSQRSALAHLIGLSFAPLAWTRRRRMASSARMH